MAQPLNAVVRYRDEAYYAAVDPAERADQLMLRSLHHFGIDPRDKHRFQLKRRGAGRDDPGIVLDHPIGEQLRGRAELMLVTTLEENRPLSTGSY